MERNGARAQNSLAWYIWLEMGAFFKRPLIRFSREVGKREFQLPAMNNNSPAPARRTAFDDG